MDSLNASRIAGGNSAYGRSQSDFYPTPPDVTVALMRFLNLPRTTSVWEPATGEGDMAGVLQTYFETVYTTDILDGTDFLKSSIDAADWIITNPPFSLAEAFIRRAAELGKPFAFLLKSQYWNATCRRKLFKLTMLCALYATMFGAFGTFAICASIYTIILLLSGEGHL